MKNYIETAIIPKLHDHKASCQRRPRLWVALIWPKTDPSTKNFVQFDE